LKILLLLDNIPFVVALQNGSVIIISCKF